MVERRHHADTKVRVRHEHRAQQEEVGDVRRHAPVDVHVTAGDPPTGPPPTQLPGGTNKRKETNDIKRFKVWLFCMRALPFNMALRELFLQSYFERRIMQKRKSFRRGSYFSMSFASILTKKQNSDQTVAKLSF